MSQPGRARAAGTRQVSTVGAAAGSLAQTSRAATAAGAESAQPEPVHGPSSYARFACLSTLWLDGVLTVASRCAASVRILILRTGR